jgi:hypothetical protein
MVRLSLRPTFLEKHRAEALVLAMFVVFVGVGFNWGLPGPDTWCVDSMSPRSCGLGAIVETYRPGHFHTYPPLHMGILTLISLPWIGLAASRVGTSAELLRSELLHPLYMTGIEVGSRLVAALMGAGIVWNTMRLWKRIAGAFVGVGAGVVAACNATLVYYAHTGNVDVPYLFWTSWALVEIDRVASGERREAQALLLAACAVLTKDQAAAALALPISIYVLWVPWRARGASIFRSDLVRATLASTCLYALVSAAVVNPSGFSRRLAFLFGPGSKTWAGYPRTVAGRAELLGDAWRAVPHFGSWPIAALAITGVVFALTSGENRARSLLPLSAAASFTVLFNLSALRSEDRFLLPQSLFLFPYAALALDRARTEALRRYQGSEWPAWLVAAASIVALAPAILGVASLDGTLLADPRYGAERFLAGISAGTPIEVLGSTKFLPRLPEGLPTVRPGVEPISDRQEMAGVREIVDPSMDPRPRAPELIVLATELSRVDMTSAPARPVGYGLSTYQDATTRLLLRRLADGSIGYSRVFRSACTLPWPLECRAVHGSTSGEVWIYGATRAGSAVP